MQAPHPVAEAMQRAVTVFTRRPDKGLHADVGAHACWHGGTRAIATHATGVSVASDMPTELGGAGDRPSPGWFFRAGIAMCAATAIAMVAAEQGVVLERLEVDVGSQSDARGMLGMRDADDQPVEAGPLSMQVDVRVHAPGVGMARLEALVAEGLRRSPMQAALSGQPPIRVAIVHAGRN